MGDYWDHRPQKETAVLVGVVTRDQTEDMAKEYLEELAFLADIPPKSAKVYLIFYGNPDAEPITYSADLKVAGEGFGLTVENEHYRVKLHPLSGADRHLRGKGLVCWVDGGTDDGGEP